VEEGMRRRGMMWLIHAKNALMVIGLTVATLVAGIAARRSRSLKPPPW
jgi:hypothetical protein